VAQPPPQPAQCPRSTCDCNSTLCIEDQSPDPDGDGDITTRSEYGDVVLYSTMSGIPPCWRAEVCFKTVRCQRGPKADTWFLTLGDRRKYRSGKGLFFIPWTLGGYPSRAIFWQTTYRNQQVSEVFIARYGRKLTNFCPASPPVATFSFHPLLGYRGGHRTSSQHPTTACNRTNGASN
jgi:hypothetical protein